MQKSIALASDHRGYELKEKIKSCLSSLGYIVNDCGPDNKKESVDYPDYGIKVANAVSRGDNDCGVLICGTGIGMSLAANKVKGIRAALCNDLLTTEMSRRHNDANILCLGADIVKEDQVEEQIKLWLSVEFEGGRHERRVKKIMNPENEPTVST
ncbi:MAG: ribose 5-phosphate isomerase B [Candidatus Anammoxibacter sp.]